MGVKIIDKRLNTTVELSSVGYDGDVLVLQDSVQHELDLGSIVGDPLVRVELIPPAIVIGPRWSQRFRDLVRDIAGMR